MANKRNSWRTRAALFGAVGVLALVAAPMTALAVPGGGGGGSPGGGGPNVRQKNIDPQQSFRDGLAALEAGDYRTAEKKFGEVLSIAPGHPETNYYMGMAKLGRGKAKSSRRYFERAVKEKPNFVEAREQLALVYMEIGKPDKAAEQLAALKDMQTQCAGACPTSLDQAVTKVEAALGGGDSAGEGEETSALEASADRFAGLFLQPVEEGVEKYHAAARLVNEGRFDEAIAELYVSQSIIGPHPDILNYLGFAHRKLGKMERAQDYYAQALSLDPKHLGATEYLGELYLEIGEIDKAKRQLAKLDKLCDFGCAEREELARLISIKETMRSAEK